MSLWLVVVICLLILFLGVIIGYALRQRFGSFGGYDGVIHVIKEEDKMVYSLELSEDPATLQYESEVIFKVLAPQ